MANGRGRNANEIGVAFCRQGDEKHIPEDTIGVVWLGLVNDRTGKRLFRGRLEMSKIPEELRDKELSVVLFPFAAGDQRGISIQLSRKHHGALSTEKGNEDRG